MVIVPQNGGTIRLSVIIKSGNIQTCGAIMLLVILIGVYVAIGALWLCILNNPKDRIHFFLLLTYGLPVNTIRSVNV